MSDREIVEALIARDGRVTERFFFKDCRPLFLSVVRNVFDSQPVDYDEIINELYILLMENDAYRLRQFHFESSLYQWLKIIAIRHCLKLKNSKMVIDVEDGGAPEDSMPDQRTEEFSSAAMDLEQLLSQMKNLRYVKVIRLMMLEDRTPEEVATLLGVNVDNLYNIKRRALAALYEVAIKDKKHYESKAYFYIR